MKRRTRIWLWVGLGFLALVMGLSYSLRPFIKEILAVRVSYILWISDLLFKSTPQVVCWTWLIFVLAVVIYKSLSVSKRDIPRPTPAPLSTFIQRERVGIWSRHVQRAMHGNHFSWLSVGEHLGELSMRVLAHQQRIKLREARLLVENGKTLDLPADVQACIEMRYRPVYINRAGWRAQISRLIRQIWFIVLRREWEQLPGLARHRHVKELDSVLSYLETQLEVRHDD